MIWILALAAVGLLAAHQFDLFPGDGDGGNGEPSDSPNHNWETKAKNTKASYSFWSWGIDYLMANNKDASGLDLIAAGINQHDYNAEDVIEATNSPAISSPADAYALYKEWRKRGMPQGGEQTSPRTNAGDLWQDLDSGTHYGNPEEAHKDELESAMAKAREFVNKYTGDAIQKINERLEQYTKDELEKINEKLEQYTENSVENINARLKEELGNLLGK